ncbi:hypothetical protein SAMN06265349_102985 [Flavobacterium resistens]|uniref:Uncharacterized protein n=1 Tax=Flavobacterium resistens TaxID=443612 RepID=A0A521CW34_9FLAO|nr:hypothetical protein [Flavobacterium resistens]MRX67052.1 hypothetical protein [Flavobacterium resistens]SMO63655.1 hypothetical protein SAMN06265349_102985 [Flavobacterium resistens]
MQKKLSFEKGTLVIGYCDNSQDISVYESGEYTEPIRLTFIPNLIMTEDICIEYTNEIMPKIIAETKIIISENDDFYKNFEFDFNSEFLGFQLERNALNNRLIVGESWMRLKYHLK